MRRRYSAFVYRHEVAWELSFALLAIVYVLLGFAADDATLESQPVPWLLELALTVVFALEFGTRLWAANSRKAYIRGHWIDVVALVPVVRGVRVFRLVRLLRLVRAFAGFARAAAALGRLARHRGLIWLLASWGGVMVVCSLGLYAAENGVNKAVDSPLDGLWWGLVTMTTVGYGDVTPVTPEGRLVASILMILGIGLYSALTATVTSFLVEADRSTPGVADELEKIVALRDRGHLNEVQYAAAVNRVLSISARADVLPENPEHAGQ